MDLQSFELRKKQHIDFAMDLRSQAQGLSGLDQIQLNHEALPEMDFAEVSLKVESDFFPTSSPFFISGMTAGHDQAKMINDRLANVCQNRGWIFGIGSQRRQLHENTREWADFRDRFPSLFVVANLGLSQLIQTDSSSLQKIFSELEPDAIAVHLNPLQEAIQTEGTPNFKGGLQRIQKLVNEFKKPIIVKETGCGISPRTASLLFDSGIHALDVSGLGGTHWGRIDGMRAVENPLKQNCAKVFWNWGVPTADSIVNASRALSNTTEVWASGGIRTGLDAAKCVALGAHRIGFAKPALEAAMQSESSLQTWIDQIEHDFKVALFCTASRNVSQLRKKESSWIRSNNF